MKVLLLKQNITDLDTLNKGVALVKQWLATINFQIQFDFQDTTKQFTTETIPPVPNLTVNNVSIVVPDQIITETPDGYDISCLVYDWDKVGLPKPTNPSDSYQIIRGITPMQIPFQWYNVYPEVFACFFLHELCHILFFRNRQTDITHNQATSSFHNSQQQDYYLFLIKGLMQNLTVNLTRTSNGVYETLGNLTAQNGGATFQCKTLELPYKGNQVDISCVPVGKYRVLRTFSWKMMKYTYELQNVPYRSGIRLHSANYFYQLKGCIALGDGFVDLNKDGQLDVKNSQNTLKSFEGFLQNKPFDLIIQ